MSQKETSLHASFFYETLQVYFTCCTPGLLAYPELPDIAVELLIVIMYAVAFWIPNVLCTFIMSPADVCYACNLNTYV